MDHGFYKLTSCNSPASTGCRFKYTAHDQVFLVSNPKRGSLRAWILTTPKQIGPGSFVERWLPCPLAEALRPRRPTPALRATVRGLLDFAKTHPEFAP